MLAFIHLVVQFCLLILYHESLNRILFLQLSYGSPVVIDSNNRYICINRSATGTVTAVLIKYLNIWVNCLNI